MFYDSDSKDKPAETQAAHTPGPWHVVPPTLGVWNYCESVASEHATVCVVVDGLRQANANARLVSAAPELLAALHDLRDVILKHLRPLPEAAIEHADRVIAKAEGREGH